MFLQYLVVGFSAMLYGIMYYAIAGNEMNLTLLPICLLGSFITAKYLIKRYGLDTPEQEKP